MYIGITRRALRLQIAKPRLQHFCFRRYGNLHFHKSPGDADATGWGGAPNLRISTSDNIQTLRKISPCLLFLKILYSFLLNSSPLSFTNLFESFCFPVTLFCEFSFSFVLFFWASTMFLVSWVSFIFCGPLSGLLFFSVGAVFVPSSLV